jgi:hypothetical protein
MTCHGLTTHNMGMTINNRAKNCVFLLQFIRGSVCNFDELPKSAGWLLRRAKYTTEIHIPQIKFWSGSIGPVQVG